MSYRRFWIIACVVFGIMFLLARSASAADVRNPTLDAIAVQAAGVPAVVHCETSPPIWRDMVQKAFRRPDFMGWEIAGFTYIATPDIYLSPTVCTTLLHTVTAGAHAAGIRPLADALQVLLHEAQHAKGESSEAVAECSANKLLPKYLSLVGVPAKIVRYVKVRSMDRVAKYKAVTVANPDVQTMVQWAKLVSSTRPAEYQGGVC